MPALIVDSLSFLLACLFTRFPTVTLPRLRRQRRPLPPPLPLNLPLDLVALVLSYHAPSPYGLLDTRVADRERTDFYRTCALVHSSWKGIAEGFLLREVRLTRGLGRFVAFVEGDEVRAEKVRNLVVDLGERVKPRGVEKTVGELTRRCVHLESLALLNVGTVMLEDLAKLTDLRRLHLNHTALSAAPCASLPPLPQLNHLSLTHTLLTAPPIPCDLSTFSYVFPSLTSLSITDSDPRIAAAFRGLKHLSLDTPIYCTFGRWLDPLPAFSLASPLPPFDFLALSTLTLSTLLSHTTSPNLQDRELDMPLSPTHLRVHTCPLDLRPSASPLEREKHELGLWRLVAALAPPSIFESTPTSPLLRVRRKGEPDPWEGLKTISLSATLVLEPYFADALQTLFAVCEAREVEIKYVDATLDEGGSRDRKRANGAVFRQGFWEEVGRLERR
ncbi:hypothetical protein JCM6882_007934 [Rhodosporidiobolus microsporus]